jgi:myosin protein heavy chain
MDDLYEYSETITAMKVIGITDDEIDALSSVVAAILHLGNVQFTGEKAALVDADALNKAAYLLGVDPTTLGKAFMKPLFITSTDTIETHVTAAQASFNRNSLIKSMYLRLFDWLVASVNATLSSRQQVKNFIGVLDIAGFEIFEHNSFEQLCINFTNEKLQQFFNSHMFKKEQEEYLREKIEWKYIDFGLDLQPTIDLIEKPMGIMSILDSQCIMPNPTEEGFVNEISKTQSGGKIFKTDKFSKIQFTVTHYAGEVTYNVSEWLSKNIDPLNNDCRSAMQNAKNPFVSRLFPVETKVAKSRTTVSTTYRAQLKGLLEVLESTEPHFVRCIVPNGNKQPGVIEAKNVLHQLRCNGVLEGIRISRKGYPGRVRYTDFNARYAILANKKQTSLDARTQALNILTNIGFQETKQYKLGQTKVFLRAGQEASIEELREKRIALVIIYAQGAIRGRLQRKRFGAMLGQKAAARLLQKNLRLLFKLKNEPWWQLMSLSRPIWVGTGPDEEAVRGKLAEEIDALEQSRKECEEARTKAEKERDFTNKEVERYDNILLQMLKEQKDLENAMQKQKDLIHKAELDINNIESSHKAADLQTQTSQNLTIDLRGKIDKKEQDINNLRKEIENLQGGVKDKSEYMKTLDNDAVEIRRMIKDLEIEYKRVRDDMDRDRTQNSGIQSQTKLLDEKVRQAQADFQVTAKARSERDVRISAFETKTSQAKTEIQNNKKSTDEITNKIIEVRNFLQMVQEEHGDTKKTLAALTKQLRTVETSTTDADKRFVEESKKRTVEENRGANLEIQIVEVKESIDQTRSDVERLEGLVEELKAEISRLKIRLQELQDQNAQLIRQRDTLIKEIKDTRAELTNEIKTLNADVERASKRTVDTAELQQYVDQQGQTQLKLKKAEADLTIAQRNLEQLEKDKSTTEEKIRKTEATIRDANAGIEDLKSKIEEMEYLQQNARNEKREAEENLKVARRDLADTVARVTATQRSVDKMREKLEKLTADKDKLSKQANSLSVDELRQLIASERKTILETKEQLAEKKDELGRLQNEVNDFERTLIKEQKNKKSDFDKTMSLQGELANEKATASATSKKNILLNAEIKRAASTLTKSQQQTQLLATRLSELETRIKGADNDTVLTRGDNTGFGKQVFELRTEVDKFKEQLTEKNRELNKANHELQKLEDKIDKLEDERDVQIDHQDTLELSIDDLNYRLDYVAQKLEYTTSQQVFLQSQLREAQNENEKRKASSPRELQAIIDNIKREIVKRTEEFEEQTRVILREHRDQRKQIKQVHEQIKRQHIEENKLDDPAEPIRRDAESKIKTLKAESEVEKELLMHELLEIGRLEVQAVDVQDKILNEQRLAKKFEAQKKSLASMLEEMKDASVDNERLKKEIAKLRPVFESKIKLEQQELAKEKSECISVEEDVVNVREKIKNIEKELNHQKKLGTKNNQDVEQNLARSLEMLQKELEADKRSIAIMEKECKKMLREYDEIQFDVVDEQKLKEEAQQYFEETQKQVAEIQQSVHVKEVAITRKQAEIHRMEKETSNDRNRIPLLEREVRKLRNTIEEEIHKQNQLNLQMSTAKVEMRDDVDFDYMSDEEMSEVEEDGEKEQSNEVVPIEKKFEDIAEEPVEVPIEEEIVS